MTGFRYAAHSEIGLVRKNNQDSGYASANLLLVADGMGGAAAGDLASAAVVQRIKRIDGEQLDPADLPERLAGAISQANDTLADLITDEPSLDGMGTTVSAVRCDGERYILAHIGDSRAYLLRAGELTRLTHDHSWVQSLVDDGRLTEAEAAEHPHRSLLLRVLNGQPNNSADLFETDAQVGDRILVCSDGLCGLVDDAQLAERITGSNLEAMVADLVSDAHAAGGSDNITIVLADYVADPTTTPVTIGAAADPSINAASVAAAQPSPPEPTPASAQSTEADRYAPRQAPPARRRIGRLLLIVLLALAVLGGLGYGGYAWSRTQYFVAPAGDRVGIYQGLNETIANRPLHSLVAAEPTLIRDLPRIRREQLAKGIAVDGLAGARRTTAELAEDAAQCRLVRERRKKPSTTATAAPPPTPNPSGPPPPGPTVSAAPKATATSTPRVAEDDC